MESLDSVVYMLSCTLDTPQKRRLVGGILLSMSLCLCGLAITAMTLGTVEDDKKSRRISNES